MLLALAVHMSLDRYYEINQASCYILVLELADKVALHACSWMLQDAVQIEFWWVATRLAHFHEKSRVEGHMHEEANFDSF